MTQATACGASDIGSSRNEAKRGSGPRSVWKEEESTFDVMLSGNIPESVKNISQIYEVDTAQDCGSLVEHPPGMLATLSPVLRVR